MNDLDRLIATIPFGRENAIDRTFLAQKMGLSDRKTRQLIEDARNAGLFIINNSDGFMRASFPDVEKKVRDAMMARIEGNIHYFEAWIHDLDNSRERMNDALYGNNAAIRRLNVAVIALAAGCAAFIAVLTSLSLV